MTPNGLIDGRTQNLSIGGAFVSCPAQPNNNHGFRMVLTAKGRLILVNAQVIWPEILNTAGLAKPGGMGVRFTGILINDRQFLSHEIAKHY
jgi:hypothetical protein